MESLRRVTIWVLLLVLLVCECAVMGIFAVDAGASERSVRDALDESEIVSDIVTESLKENSVNGAAAYGDVIEELAESDAMTDFFAAYISNGIRESVYGHEVSEIAYDKLLQAVDKGVDQVNEERKSKGEGEYISSEQKAVFMMAASKTAPELTKGLNAVISSFETTATGSTDQVTSSVESSSTIPALMNPVTRVVLLIIIAASIAMLALLSKKDGHGTMRVAGATLVATVLYGAVAFRGTGMTSTASDVFLNELIIDGAAAVAIAGAVVTAIMAVTGIVAGRIRKHRENV